MNSGSVIPEFRKIEPGSINQMKGARRAFFSPSRGRSVRYRTPAAEQEASVLIICTETKLL